MENKDLPEIKQKINLFFKELKHQAPVINAFNEEGSGKARKMINTQFSGFKKTLQNIWFQKKVSMDMVRSMDYKQKMILGAVVKNKFGVDINLQEEKALKDQLNCLH